MTDANSEAAAAPPIYLQPRALGLVFVGGTAGAGSREALTLAFSTDGTIDWVIFAINLTGAFLLGFLLENLAGRGPDRGRRRSLRLVIGTGFMGGFTTYSTLAAGTASLIRSGDVAAGIGYAVGTVLLGAVATWAGIALAARARRRRETQQ
ncbi:MAG: fluoride efflux transporter FluC [Cumulibacter sp.]